MGLPAGPGVSKDRGGTHPPVWAPAPEIPVGSSAAFGSTGSPGPLLQNPDSSIVTGGRSRPHEPSLNTGSVPDGGEANYQQPEAVASFEVQLARNVGTSLQVISTAAI